MRHLARFALYWDYREPARATMASQIFQRSEADGELIHRSMNYLTVFRLALAITIAIIAFGNFGAVLSPGYKVFLARSSGLIYSMAAISFAWMHWRDRIAPGELLRFALLTDIVILLVTLHCFGGFETGLVILLIFTIGIAGLLLPLEIALFYAALVTLGLIAEVWIGMQAGASNGLVLQAGIYGIAAFVTALSCSLLGHWGREYQLLAERRREDLLGLEKVNDLIIRRMRSGVMVVDSNHNVRQINESAWYLLGSPASSERRLSVIAPALLERLIQWRKTGRTEEEALLLKATQAAVIPQFVRLPGTFGEATLIFLEDTSVVTRRARDLAQASLARLSASIAHEIRNPLGALSHAAQLLGESGELPKQDRRLIEIISNHTARMNDIVENVLKLSRREPARVQHVNLSDWTRELSEDFRREHKLPASRVRVQVPRTTIEVLMDPSQMRQAVGNLMDNALRHAGNQNHPPTITLRASPIRGHREMALDILDDGPGIPLDKRSQIFEPFFTTHKQGSGLGLFLARQICDANRAPLEYVEMPNAGACFRILLPRVGAEIMVGQSAGLARI